MRTYKKTHQSKKAFENHLTLLKARGANIEKDGLTLKYSFDDEKDVYGDKLNQWHDTSFDGDGDSFAYSTKNGTVMYGKDLENGGFFSASTTEKYYFEYAPQKSYKHSSMKEAKKNALVLLKEFKKK